MVINYSLNNRQTNQIDDPAADARVIGAQSSLPKDNQSAPAQGGTCTELPSENDSRCTKDTKPR